MSEVANIILEQLNNIVVVVDKTAQVSYVSPSVKRLLGYEPEALMGKGWWDLTRDKQEDRDALQGEAASLICGDKVLNSSPYERLVRTADGGYKWILWNSSFGPDNSLIGIGYDISERKAAEELLEEKNRELRDSMEYASHIQQAILPTDEEINSAFSDAFVYYQPKDIVSGDFYWFHKKGNKVFVAAMDCTGHGVPGAMVSVMGNSLLKDIISKMGLEDPAEILAELDKEIIYLLNEKNTGPIRNDGMDISLVQFDYDENVVRFCGAYRPLILIRDGELIEYAGERCPIGYFFGIEKGFTTTEIPLQPNDVFYMFSDGYTDQFGGDNVRKFNRKRFRNLLLSIQEMNMARQQKELADAFHRWKGKSAQIDDVLVIGLRV